MPAAGPPGYAKQCPDGLIHRRPEPSQSRHSSAPQESQGTMPAPPQFGQFTVRHLLSTTPPTKTARAWAPICTEPSRPVAAIRPEPRVAVGRWLVLRGGPGFPGQKPHLGAEQPAHRGHSFDRSLGAVGVYGNEGSGDQPVGPPCSPSFPWPESERNHPSGIYSGGLVA